MENASKALIIAGAILLSILLISLGIMVYTNARGSIGNANLNSEEIQTFNTKISQYCGGNKSANDMNALMSAVSASNGAQKGKANQSQHWIKVVVNVTNVSASYFSGAANSGYYKDSDDGPGKIWYTTKYPNFSEGIKYKATYHTDESGYIYEIDIDKK